MEEIAEKTKTVEVCKGCGNEMNGATVCGTPVCSACIGLNKESGKPVRVKIELKDLKCESCGKRHRRGTNLFCINYQNKTFYCGCRGWG